MGIRAGLRMVPLVLALAAAGCGPAILGLGVAVGLRGLAERSTEEVASDTRVRVASNVALQERASDLYVTLGVEVYRGRVLLTGVVPNEEEKVRVGQIVRAVENVREVLNEVQIGEPSSLSDYARDFAVGAAVRFRLIEHDKTAQALDMEFEVVNGTVYVVGWAASPAARLEIAEILSTTAGVKAVVLHLELADPSGQPDS